MNPAVSFSNFFSYTQNRYRNLYSRTGRVQERERGKKRKEREPERGAQFILAH
jgi:hypothetical protein